MVPLPLGIAQISEIAILAHSTQPILGTGWLRKRMPLSMQKLHEFFVWKNNSLQKHVSIPN